MSAGRAGTRDGKADTFQFRSLQYLRGIAALLVVYMHAALQLQINSGGVSSFPAIGSAGVDIFFVLSGFVMWVSNPVTRVESTVSFYKRRILRLVPLYWIVTLFALTLALALPGMTRSITPTPDHVVASLLFIPWPNPAFSIGSPNFLTPLIVPGWTLNYEMFFYALFGLVLPFSSRVRIGIVVGVFGVLFAMKTLLGPLTPTVAFYASGYLLEFLIGALIAMAGPQLHWRRDVAAVGVAVALIWLLAAEVFDHGTFSLVTRAPPAALAVMAAVALERNGGLFRNATMGILGDASYSIYLSHGFVIAFMRGVWRVLKLGYDVPAQTIFIVSCIVLGSLFGILIYLAVERPLLRLTRTW